MYKIKIMAFLLEDMTKVYFNLYNTTEMSRAKLKEFTQGFAKALGTSYEVIWAEETVNDEIKTCVVL